MRICNRSIACVTVLSLALLGFIAAPAPAAANPELPPEGNWSIKIKAKVWTKLGVERTTLVENWILTHTSEDTFMIVDPAVGDDGHGVLLAKNRLFIIQGQDADTDPTPWSTVLVGKYSKKREKIRGRIMYGGTGSQSALRGRFVMKFIPQ